MSEEAPNVTAWIYSKEKYWRKSYKNEKGDKENGTTLLKNNCVKVEDVSSVTTCCGEVISMFVVLMKITYQNTGNELNTCALLDSFSQGTFIRRDIAPNRGASRYETQTSVKQCEDCEWKSNILFSCS